MNTVNHMNIVKNMNIANHMKMNIAFNAGKHRRVISVENTHMNILS